MQEPHFFSKRVIISGNLKLVIISLDMKYMQTAVDAALKDGEGFSC